MEGEALEELDDAGPGGGKGCGKDCLGTAHRLGVHGKGMRRKGIMSWTGRKLVARWAWKKGRAGKEVHLG